MWTGRQLYYFIYKKERKGMILSLALIIAVIFGATPFVLIALLITWIPDIVLIEGLCGRL